MEKQIKLINDTFEYDQKLRLNSAVSVEVLNNFCDTLTTIVKSIIGDVGIASPDKVGNETARKFLILLDHMGDKQYFCSIVEEKQLLDLKFDKPTIALLMDKLLNIQGRKQRFGTILEAYKDTENNIKSRPLPIEDEENVEKRREEFGMQPLHQYIEKSNEVFKKIKREETKI